MPNFLQTQAWAQFWQQANPQNHRLLQFPSEGETVFVYEYPWQLQQKFWYLPRVAFSDFKQISRELCVRAERENVCFLKVDFLSENEQKMEQNLEIKPIQSEKKEDLKDGEKDQEKTMKQIQTEEILEQVKNLGLGFEARLSGKKLQYLETMFLPLQDLAPVQTGLGDFLQVNKPFFEKYLDKRTRYGTRKSLEQAWRFSASKTEENFQAFWELHQETAARQKFGFHSQDYLKTLFEQDFSRLFLLLDETGQVHSAWFGVATIDTLVHLYGGNSPLAREKFGQYLLHLGALSEAKREGLSFYDFGGLEEGKGFDMFKKGYLGQKETYLGPIDLIFKPRKFTFINSLISWRKNF